MISSTHARLLKACACSMALVCLLGLIAKTWPWPMISDATFMHYAVFLMRHGEAPYRQVGDINMPGVYATGWAANGLFGSSPLGWRLFDISLMAAAAAAMVSIAGQKERAAGLFAGLLFALVHGGDGVAEAGQRDFVMAVLLLAACAFVFCAVRQGRWVWMVLFGLAAGGAVTIKPTALVFALALLGLGVAARRTHGFLLAGSLGLLLPPVAAGLWLWRAGSVAAFRRTVTELLPYHAAMARHTPGFLLQHIVPGPMVPVALLGGFLLAVNWRRADSKTGWEYEWERLALIAGVLAGFGSYYAQGKAYPYHRYPMLAFLLLAAALEFSRALRSGSRALRWLGVVGFAYGALWLAPASTAKALRYDWRDQRSLAALEGDLARLGGTALSGRVQCMDTMAGCLTVLDRMRLVESTGLLYDCYLFAPERARVQERLRAEFFDAVRQDPPEVFIVTDQYCFNQPPGYGKLAAWPAFEAYLTEHYRLEEQRTFAEEGTRRLAAAPFGYRIYVRRRP